MIRILCMCAALTFMLAGPGAAADRKFSWDDDAISSSDRSSPAKRGWSDEGFSSGTKELNTASEGGELRSGVTSGKAPMSWDGGMDEPERKAGRRNAGKSGMTWGDDIDQPGKKDAALPGKRLAMLVTDRDRAGTNVRSAPSGRKTQVIPLRSADEVRTVVLSGNAGKGWFELAPGGLAERGWMHGSVLGICTGGRAKGGVSVHIEPSADAPALKIRSGLPLSPLDIRGGWVKVRLGFGKDGSECWIQKEDLYLDDGELSDCAGVWADR